MNHIGIKHPQAHNQTFSREGFDCHYSGEVVESGRGHPCPQAHNQTFSREGVQLPLQWGRVGVVGKIEIFALKWCILVHKTCTINFWTWWSHGIHMNHLNPPPSYGPAPPPAMHCCCSPRNSTYCDEWCCLNQTPYQLYSPYAHALTASCHPCIPLCPHLTHQSNYMMVPSWLPKTKHHSDPVM